MPLRTFSYEASLLHVALNGHTLKPPTVYRVCVLHTASQAQSLCLILLIFTVINANAPEKPDALGGFLFRKGFGWLHLCPLLPLRSTFQGIFRRLDDLSI